MSAWDYFAPEKLAELWPLLEKFGDTARLKAGGTDLLVQIRDGDFRPRCLIDLRRIPELSGGICFPPGGGACIPPLMTLADLSSAKLADGFSVLAEASRVVGSPQIRNRATIGGNICRAAPSADLVPALLVLNAAISVKSSAREREVRLSEFFSGPGKTTLQPGEILAQIRIPPQTSSSFSVYLKHGPRRSMDLATVGAAVAIDFDSAHSCRTVRIALASVAPTPMRARAAEFELEGRRLSPEGMAQAALAAAAESRPITDGYGPDWYKREIVAVLVRRALEQIQSRAKEARHAA